MVQYALIVAGGKGLRMGTELPKQFLPIGGKPVLMRTLEAFYDYNAEIRIILVLPHSQQDYWRQLCREYCFSLPHAIADWGGDAVPLRKEWFGFGQDTCFGRCARWGASVRGPGSDCTLL